MTITKKLGAGLPWMALSLLILAFVLVLESGQAVTQASAPVQDLAPDSLIAGVDQASLALEKAAWPLQVMNGELVTYTVTVSNTGDMTGTIDAIVDTLDPGLTFTGMLTGSGIITPPQEISNTLTWTGPFTLPAGSVLMLLYQAQTPPVDGWTSLCNRVEISTTETAPPVAEACVDVRPEFFYSYLPCLFRDFDPARLEVDKAAWPTTFMADPAAEVVYTVTVASVGDVPGTLLAVNDTLPAGFTFLGMEPGSDVTTDPAGITGTITWNGNWPMPPDGQLDVVYRVRPSEVAGQYANSVTVVAQDALTPEAPAVASVVIEPATLLEDDFNDGAVGIGRWTPFLNYWRLEPGQWYWGANAGVGGTGAATHDCWLGGEKIAEDGLLMYLDDEAFGWTDYRVETKLLLRGGVTEEDGEHVVIEEGGYPIGLWVRGQYQDVGDADTAGWTTGYYAMVGGKPDKDTMFVRLLQLQTETDCWGNACDNPHNLYDYNNPHKLHEVILPQTFLRHQWYTLAVEVRGANIKIFWEGVPVLEYTDGKEPFMTGTVGFKTFKSKTVSFDDVVVMPLSD